MTVWKCLRCAVVYGCVSALVDSVGMEELERERRRQVVEKFQKAPFEEIAAHCGARVRQRYNNIWTVLFFKCYSFSNWYFLMVSNEICSSLCRPHNCRVNWIRSLRLQSGEWRLMLYWRWRVSTRWWRCCRVMTKSVASSHADLRPARLEPFHQVTAKLRTVPCRSTRWNFPTFASTKPQRRT